MRPGTPPHKFCDWLKPDNVQAVLVAAVTFANIVLIDFTLFGFFTYLTYKLQIPSMPSSMPSM